MIQSHSGPTIIAQVVHWTYRGTSEERGDEDFFSTLALDVASEIATRLRGKRIWVGREIQIALGDYVLQARLTGVEPPLANFTDHTTEFLAEYRQRAKDEGQDVSTFLA